MAASQQAKFTTCHDCQCSFERKGTTYEKKRKYCPECYPKHKYENLRKRKRVDEVCIQCGEPFYYLVTKDSNRNPQKYCKNTCYNTARAVTWGTIGRTCKHCCTMFFAKWEGQLYCSVSCAGKVNGPKRKIERYTTCANCGTRFKQKRKYRKYCSKKCYHTLRRSRWHEHRFNCELCGAEKTRPYRFRAQRFCSIACSAIANGLAARDRVNLICEWCKKEYETIISGAEYQRFCCIKCFHYFLRDGSEKTVKLICENCNDEFERSWLRRGTRFCGKSCAFTGDNNPMKQKEAREKVSAKAAQRIVDGKFKPNTYYRTGHFTTSKNFDGSVYYRSSYELHALQLLNAYDDVIELQTEPFKIAYEYNNITHNYVPDILVTKQDGSHILIEIKPEAFVLDEQNISKMTAGIEHCQTLGIEFELWAYQACGKQFTIVRNPELLEEISQ